MSNHLQNLAIFQQLPTNSWHVLLENFFSSETGEKLLDFLAAELKAGKTIFPTDPLRVYRLLQPQQVRVVILGQDPYHQPNQAQGIAFSVAANMVLPPSLANIFREMAANFAIKPPVCGDLSSWAKEGIFLLNSCLTVEQNIAASHSQKGWEVLTQQTVEYLNQQPQPILFVLWGRHAQTKIPLITALQHKIIYSNHPSPLAAAKGRQPFLGNGHFTIIENWLNNSDNSLKKLYISEENQQQLELF